MVVAAHDSELGGAGAIVACPGGRLVTAGRDGAVVVVAADAGFPEVEVDGALAEAAKRDGTRRRNAPVGSEPADDPTEPVFKDQRPADDEVPEKEDEGKEGEVRKPKGKAKGGGKEGDRKRRKA